MKQMFAAKQTTDINVDFVLIHLYNTAHVCMKDCACVFVVNEGWFASICWFIQTLNCIYEEKQTGLCKTIQLSLHLQ